MRLDEILDNTLELLIANADNPRFKSFGSLKKSKFQHSKPEEDRINRSEMYKGRIGNSEAVKKGHIKRKQNPNYKEDIKKAAQKRSNWYNSRENRAKFIKAIKQRDQKRKEKNLT